MHLSLASALLASVLVAVPYCAQAQGKDAPAMECNLGPLTRTFGGTPWLVYSCSDGTSIVVVTKEENPAAPFYFFVFKREGKYVVFGEGTGAKSITDLAYNELIKLKAEDIRSLIAASKRIPPALGK